MKRMNQTPAGKKRVVKRNLEAYSFMIPNLILFLGCSIYPVLWALKYAFYQYGGYGTVLLVWWDWKTLQECSGMMFTVEFSPHLYLWIWKIIDHPSPGFFPGFFIKYPQKGTWGSTEYHLPSYHHEFCRDGTCVLSSV